MNFSYALDYLKDNKKLTRTNWNGKNMYIQLQNPNEKSKMTRPYIYMFTVNADLVPWCASQSDILAEDWELANGS